MDDLFLKILNMSILASYIIIAAVIIRLVFKKAPKWINYVIWSMVGIRLVIPFSIKSIFSLIPKTDVIPGNVTTVNNITDIGAIAGNLTPGITSQGTVGNSPDFISIVSFIWLVGMGLLVLYGIVSYVILRRKVSDAEKSEENIYSSKNIASPFILGIIKPKIYLPYAVDKQNIPHIIAHEKAHLKRKDHWIKPFGYALLTVYWFNPLIWLAYILMCRDIELACDEAVIRKLGAGQKKQYSETLLSCSMKRRVIAACPLAFGEVGVKERIRNVLSYKKPTLWIIITAVIISAVLAVVFLTNPKDRVKLNFPVGSYAFDSVVYMNPLSSYYPFEDTGEIYDITKNRLAVSDKKTGEIIKEVSFDRTESQNFTNKEWTELFIFEMNLTDIASIDKNSRTMWELSDDYRVYKMNDEVWLMRLSGKNGVWSIYKLKEYEEELIAVSDNVPKYWETVSDEENMDSLDKIIPHMIYQANLNETSTADISTQAYTILDKEDSEDELLLYVMAMYLEFNVVDGRLIEASGSHSPVVITLEKGDNGGYGQTEYWRPGDGAGYLVSLRKKFPENFNEELWDTQKFVKVHLQTCYESAIEQSGIEVNTQIKQMIESISESPALMSNPYSYIKDKEIELEYRQLIYYGNYTLRYCFGKFQEGGQTGLEGYLMAIICCEILDIAPEEGQDFGYTNGQEWYDNFHEIIRGVND